MANENFAKDDEYVEGGEEVVANNPHEEEPLVCRNCGDSYIEPGYEFPLCQRCRDQFTRQPIPAWIWGGLAAVLVVALIAMINFPTTLQAAIAVERGKRAETELRHITAIREYEKACEIFPDSTEILGRMTLAFHRAGNLPKTMETYEKIVGREVKSDYLLDKLVRLADEFSYIYAIDEEIAEIIQLPMDKKRAAGFEAYLAKHPFNPTAQYYLADTYYEIGEIRKAQEELRSLVLRVPNWDLATLFLAVCHMELGELDQATDFCETVLVKSKEHPYALSIAARIQLKKHNYEYGLKLAEEAFSYDPQEPPVIGALALAYHFNDQSELCDQTIAKLREATAEDPDYLNKFTDIITGKKKWN